MPECNCKAFDNSFEFQHDNRSIVPCRDKGHATEYLYKNQSSNYLAKYRVDGGLISDNEKKCDYLLLNCNKKQAYFIELKGSDIHRSIKQIDRSIDMLKHKLPNFAIFVRIVISRINTTALNDIGLLKLKRKVESLNGNLKKGSGLLEETI